MGAGGAGRGRGRRLLCPLLSPLHTLRTTVTPVDHRSLGSQRGALCFQAWVPSLRYVHLGACDSSRKSAPHSEHQRREGTQGRTLRARQLWRPAAPASCASAQDSFSTANSANTADSALQPRPGGHQLGPCSAPRTAPATPCVSWYLPAPPSTPSQTLGCPRGGRGPQAVCGVLARHTLHSRIRSQPVHLDQASTHQRARSLPGRSPRGLSFSYLQAA